MRHSHDLFRWPFLLLLGAALVVPSAAFGQTAASKHFPDDRACVAPNDANVPNAPPNLRSLGLQIAYGRGSTTHYFSLSTVCSNLVNGDPIALDQPCALGAGCSMGGTCLNQLKEQFCMTGNAVSDRIAKAICYQAVGKRDNAIIAYQVYTNLADPANQADCDNLVGAAYTLTVRDPTIPANCGFQLEKKAGEPDGGLHFSEGGPNPCQYYGIFSSVNGTTVRTDMQNHYFTQVDCNGHTSSSDTFTYKVWQTGSAPPAAPYCSFTVGCDSANIHQDIQNGFGSGNCSGLRLVPLEKTLKDESEFTAFGPNPYLPEGVEPYQHWEAGSYVVIENAGAKIEEVQVSVSNADTYARAETSNKALLGVPALNPWGVAALIGLILLSSLWFLVRRGRPRSA